MLRLTTRRFPATLWRARAKRQLIALSIQTKPTAILSLRAPQRARLSNPDGRQHPSGHIAISDLVASLQLAWDWPALPFRPQELRSLNSVERLTP